MTYVYDLILNFHSNLYDFYEWYKNDEFLHIKRIGLIKISSQTYNAFLDYKIKVNDEFLLSIFHKCEYYENRGVMSLPYAFLVTDSYRVMGLLINTDGYIIKYSSLLLDEEEDVLDIANRLAITNLIYQKEKMNKSNSCMTRNEEYIIKYIKSDLIKSYKEKNISKLKYLYYEYFNQSNDNIDDIFQSLIDELDNNFNDKHYSLYNLIKLSLSQRSV